MLKVTNVKLEKKYLILICNYSLKTASKRHSKVNNKHIKNYDPTKPSKYVSYLDMNNLYGWAINQYVPHGGFNWLKNVDKFDVKPIREKSSIEYIIEVD